MSTTIVELSPGLQALVDERLDSIERVLLIAGVSRGERRGIVSEVEAHVFELLGRRDTGEPTREDVLAVLSRLDPPESYAPEGFDRRLASGAWPTSRQREPQLSLLAVGSAAAGAFVAAASIVSAIAFDELIFFTVGALFVLVVSIAGCVSLVHIHRSQGWLYGTRPALFSALLFPLLAVNVLAFFGLGNELAVYACLTVAFFAFNGAVIYAAWRLCAASMPKKGGTFVKRAAAADLSF